MKIKAVFLIIFLSFFSSLVWADESDLIQADRQALVEANTTGISSKIIAAKEQLSDDLDKEAEQRRQDMEGSTVPLVADDQGHLVADVLINSKIHTALIVDTGSPVIILNSSFVQKLGLDLSQSASGYVEVLNGKYKAATVLLDSVRLGQAKIKNVSAIVLLQDNKEIMDGILGMSFLSKFHFTVDHAGQKLILRKSQY